MEYWGNRRWYSSKSWHLKHSLMFLFQKYNNQYKIVQSIKMHVYVPLAVCSFFVEMKNSKKRLPETSRVECRKSDFMQFLIIAKKGAWLQAEQVGIAWRIFPYFNGIYNQDILLYGSWAYKPVWKVFVTVYDIVCLVNIFP